MGQFVSFDEKQFKAKNGTAITYIEDPFPVENFLGESKILFVFQSLGDEKSEDPVKRYPYTLLAGLKYLNCRKIYIKDDKGLVGDYYLGVDGKTNTKDAVSEFIREKISSYKILRENVNFLGFSKGAFAALMFSHEVGGRSAICAIPQFDLEKWIERYKPHLSYIYPSKCSAEEKKMYATVLSRQIEGAIHAPDQIYIVTSRNDETFQDHIPPLLGALNRKARSKVNVFYNDEIFVTRHNNVVKNSMNEIFAILAYELASPQVRKFFRD